MKRVVILVLCLLLSCSIGCGKAKPQHSFRQTAGAKPVRAPERLFKGVELYSWKPAGEDWHFSLLPGTNRTKELGEIIDPTRTIVGVADLKRHLSTLALGEWLLWNNGIVIDAQDRPEWSNLATPVPRELANDVSAYCRGLRIRLHGP